MDAQPENCPTNFYNCTNTIGSYTCDCETGYYYVEVNGTCAKCKCFVISYLDVLDSCICYRGLQLIFIKKNIECPKKEIVRFDLFIYAMNIRVSYLVTTY